MRKNAFKNTPHTHAHTTRGPPPPSLNPCCVLFQSFGWQWAPLLDTLKVSKNKRDRFWPVGVVTGKLLAATLKGGEEHPAAYPRPVLTGGCPCCLLLKT